MRGLEGALPENRVPLGGQSARMRKWAMFPTLHRIVVRIAIGVASSQHFWSCSHFTGCDYGAGHSILCGPL